MKDPKKAAWAWIVDFPMFDYSETEEGRIDFGHNPFSMPQGGMKALEEEEPLKIKAFQFDLVINGFEASSGAIRNHNPEIMYKAFEIASYTREEVDAKFSGMIEAFKFGAPPHGGNAPGLDRILMTLLELNSIRDIYAFPKDGNGRDTMMDSPRRSAREVVEGIGSEIAEGLIVCYNYCIFIFDKEEKHMKTLIVYYTRTGTTKKFAESLAQELSADLEELKEDGNYAGAIGWLRAGKAGGSRKEVEIPRNQI